MSTEGNPRSWKFFNFKFALVKEFIKQIIYAQLKF